jgi:gluconate 5-dehydrogenase
VNLFDLSGRTALVTGSTRGLGLALAQALADAGARVAINGRTASACEERAAAIQGAVAAPFDVTDEDAVASGVAALGQVDVLVSNAGMTLRKPLEQFTLAEWRALLDETLTSAFLVARAVAPGMIDRRAGKIVTVCSSMSDLARETVGGYAATKRRAEDADPLDVRRLGALQHPGERHRPRLLPHGADRAAHDERGVRRVAAQRSAGRWGEPSELAGASSSSPPPTNGQILYVDGGIRRFCSTVVFCPVFLRADHW